jgi:CSLREA domain-containing protein
MPSKKKLCRKRDSRRPLVQAAEMLELRLVLSSAVAMPGALPVEVLGPNGQMVPLSTAGPTGYTPQQLQTAYGLGQISFAGIKGDGTGQTIALVDAFDNPGFVNSTAANFSTSALHQFDVAFGLPDPPSFTKVNQSGQTTGLPAANTSWGPEIALDIEWAHAMAPGANIILVEANSASGNDLFAAAAEAGKLASVVSMSWGGLEDSSETSLDSSFNVPGVTYLAATGDSGAPGLYPAFSPHVVAVGGTSLQNLNASGTYPGTGPSGEVGWSGSGGGVSQIESEPSYQASVQSTGFRTIPDIAADADPNTGVPVYDPFDTGTATPWTQYGGTSVASPLMAGMVAIADQGRGQPFSSDQFLTALYSLHNSKPGDFHDIVNGNNGNPAGPGYDLVTGLGSPNGSLLVLDLASFTPATLKSITVTPSNPSVGEGLTEQFTAMGTYSDGSTLNITNSVTWKSATQSVATINASGLATTDGVGTSIITAALNGITSQNDTLTSLALTKLALAPINPSVPEFSTVQFTATGTYSDGSTATLPGTSVTWASATPAVATIGASGLATTKGVGTSSITAAAFGVSSPSDTLTVTPPSFVVNTTQDVVNATDGKTSLREAIMAANVSPTNVTIGFDPTVFATLQTITLALGELELSNTTALETIVGPTAGVKVSGGGLSRVFQVDAGVTAAFSKMTITGGKTSADGGGLYNLGTATLTSCTISGNSAADGGGVMNDGGTATLTGCTISGNSATGGAYYSNGGGLENSQGTATLTNCTVSGNSAATYGGGISDDSGTAILKNCTVSGNSGVYGGGVNIGPLGMATLTNCTVSGNSGRYGAGLFAGASFLYGPAYYSTATLTNCTVSGNHGFAGGGVYNQGALNIANTIVARNSASYGGPDFFSILGSINSAGHNLIGATDDSTGWTGSDLTGTAAAPLNPRLAALANYGGPTKTMALLPGSPAIDAGTSAGAPATDQRGKARVGAVDIGAFESQGFTLTPVAGSTPQSAAVGAAFTNALAVTVKANNSVEPVNGGVIKFVANPAANGASATLSAASAVIAGGTASVKATANSVIGSYTVSASARGVPTAAQFALSNHAAGAAVPAGQTGTRRLFGAADAVGPSQPGVAADNPLAGAPIEVSLAPPGEMPHTSDAPIAPSTAQFDAQPGDVGVFAPPLSKGGQGGSRDDISRAPLAIFKPVVGLAGNADPGNFNIFFDINSGRFMGLGA